MRVSCRMVTGNDEERKYSMHARLFENYENGMILAQASKQANRLISL